VRRFAPSISSIITFLLFFSSFILVVGCRLSCLLSFLYGCMFVLKIMFHFEHMDSANQSFLAAFLEFSALVSQTNSSPGPSTKTNSLQQQPIHDELPYAVMLCPY
jgi:hypothetical protein